MIEDPATCPLHQLYSISYSKSRESVAQLGDAERVMEFREGVITKGGSGLQYLSVGFMHHKITQSRGFGF